MAFPTKILLPDGIVMTIADALSRTITPRWFWGKMRRDLVSAAKLGNSHQPVVLLEGATTVPDAAVDEQAITGGGLAITAKGPIQSFSNAGVHALTGSTLEIPIIGGGTTKAATTDVEDASFDEDDDIGHIGSRPDPELRTLIEYWSSATQPGIATVLTATAVNGSAEITVPSNHTLTVGQKLTANASFAAGATVVALKYKPELVDSTSEADRAGILVMLSHKAGAGATTELFTFEGSTLIAWHTPEGDIAAGGAFALLT